MCINNVIYLKKKELWKKGKSKIERKIFNSLISANARNLAEFLRISTNAVHKIQGKS